MSAPSTSGLSVNYCYELLTLNKAAFLGFALKLGYSLSVLISAMLTLLKC